MSSDSWRLCRSEGQRMEADGELERKQVVPMSKMVMIPRAAPW